MKHLMLFILLFGIIIFPMACKKNSQNNNKALLVGKWNNISTYKSGGTHLRNWTGGQYLSLREDGTFDEYGNIFDYGSSAASSSHGGTYSIDGDILSLITSRGSNYSFKVQTLTNNSLVLRAGLDILWDYSK